MSELRTAFLTGPNEYRSAVFGDASQRRTRLGYAAAAGVLIFALRIDPFKGLVVGGLVGIAIILLLNPTVSGDLLSKLVARYRWRQRVRSGADRFVPYDEARAKEIFAKGNKGMRRDLGALRAMPDGCDGMGWLRCGVDETGIAWHEPLDGSTPYLSVAFEVGGRMQGFESVERLNFSTQRWGAFLATLAGDFSLCRYVQVVTRILPPDAAYHEVWARDHMDRDLAHHAGGRTLLRSYEEVLAEASSIGTVQRHYIVLRYDIDGDFTTRAARYAPGIEGWRILMDAEVAAAERGLRNAGVGTVQPLTARSVAAFIRHAQDPSHPIDQRSDIDVTNFGVPSFDTRAMYVTNDMGDPEGKLHWYSATARVTAENMDAGLKNMLWVNGWLVDMPEPIVRTMSFHMRIVPARTARALARSDETADLAEYNKAARKGILDSEVEARQAASRQRAEDLRPGSGHHGIEWLGFVTVTAASPMELDRHSRMVAERASTQLGVRRLEWCRDYQSVAAGFTWPIARALHPHKRASLGTRVDGAIARLDTEGQLS